MSMKGTMKYGPDVAVAPEDPAPQILVIGPQRLAEAGDGCPGPATVHQIHSALLEINHHRHHFIIIIKYTSRSLK